MKTDMERIESAVQVPGLPSVASLNGHAVPLPAQTAAHASTAKWCSGHGGYVRRPEMALGRKVCSKCLHKKAGYLSRAQKDFLRALELQTQVIHRVRDRAPELLVEILGELADEAGENLEGIATAIERASKPRPSPAVVPPLQRQGKSTSRKYPWPDLIDGQWHLLKGGQDFSCRVDTMASYAREWGRTHNCKARVQIHGGDVYVCFEGEGLL